MKLRSLELEQFRKFNRPIRLSGFGDQVNVLAGPNEFGKSTVLAAIRGLFFERYNSRAEPVKRMQHWQGNAAPRVAMEFELAGDLWRIEKRFLHQPMAALTAPDGRRFDGDAAEEELQRLLAFAPAGKQGARPEHMGVWGALWVTQRDSVVQPDLTSGLARKTITNCLDAEVGVLTGSEKGEALLRLVREQLGQLVSSADRPRGRYGQVIAELEKATSTVTELKDRAARLGEDSAALGKALDRLARVDDAKADQEDREAIIDARGRKEDALNFRHRLDAAQKAYDLAAKQQEDARREHQARATRSEATAAAQTARAEAVSTETQARSAVDEIEAEVASQRAAVEAAQQRSEAASQAARCARDVANFVRRAADLAAQEQTVADAEAVQEQVTHLTAKLDGIPIDGASIDAVREAVRRRDAAQASLGAQATQIDLDLRPEAVGLVSVDGVPLAPERRSIAAVDDTNIDVEGIGRIRIRPVIGDRRKLEKVLTSAGDDLRNALAAANCATPDDAEQKWAERDKAERDLEAARNSLARLAPGDKKSRMPPGIGPLRDKVALLRESLRGDRERLHISGSPPQDEADEAIRTAETAQRAAEEESKQARGSFEGTVERRTQAREGLARLEEQRKAAQADLDRLAAEAAAAETKESSEALKARVAAASADGDAKRTELDTLTRNRSADTPEAMQARIARYEAARENRRQAILRLKEEIAGLRSRISQEGGFGLDEQLAAAVRTYDALVQERGVHEREVRVLKCLLETLTAAETETREQYLAPVIRRVTPYLRTLFPGADVSCDDALRITGLTRGAAGAEDFEFLSDGTQEQLAVLARLAFAEMLIDQGQPAMVILDDALAYADAERMERMFDVLAQAAAKTQILVLTCREDLFARLGGVRLDLVPA